MAYGDATQIVSGHAKIYLLETETTVAPITSGAITDLDSSTTWISLGYTQDGISQTITTELTEVEVDQEDAPVASTINKQSASVSTVLAQTDLLGLAYVIHGASFTTGTSSSAGTSANVMGIGGGTQAFNSLAIISDSPETGLERLDFYPRVKPTGSTVEAFKRGESHQVPVEFAAYSVSTLAAGSRLRITHEETTSYS